MTIADAAKKVLQEAGKPLSTQQIFDEITNNNLYSFSAKNPKGVLSQAIRERSDANPKAKSVIFKAMGQSIYTLAN